MIRMKCKMKNKRGFKKAIFIYVVDLFLYLAFVFNVHVLFIFSMDSI